MNDEELKQLFADNRRHTESLIRESRHHFEILSGATRQEVKQVAEGVDILREQLTQFREGDVGRVWREFDEVKAMMKFSHAELHRQITDLTQRVEQPESVVFREKR